MSEKKKIGKYKCTHCERDIELVTFVSRRTRPENGIEYIDLYVDKINGELAVDMNYCDHEGNLLTDYGCPYCNKILAINKKDIFQALTQCLLLCSAE